MKHINLETLRRFLDDVVANFALIDHPHEKVTFSESGFMTPVERYQLQELVKWKEASIQGNTPILAYDLDIANAEEPNLAISSSPFTTSAWLKAYHYPTSSSTYVVEVYIDGTVSALVEGYSLTGSSAPQLMAAPDEAFTYTLDNGLHLKVGTDGKVSIYALNDIPGGTTCKGYFTYNHTDS